MTVTPPPTRKLKAGDSRRFRLTVTDADVTPAEPKDLTTVTAITCEFAPFNVRSWTITPYRASSTEAVVTKTLGAGIEIEGDPVDGVIVVTVTGADTVSWLGDYRHETRITDALGNVVTVAYLAADGEIWHFGVVPVEPQYIVEPTP